MQNGGKWTARTWAAGVLWMRTAVLYVVVLPRLAASWEEENERLSAHLVRPHKPPRTSSALSSRHRRRSHESMVVVGMMIATCYSLHVNAASSPYASCQATIPPTSTTALLVVLAALTRASPYHPATLGPTHAGSAPAQATGREKATYRGHGRKCNGR